jgi:hypothetical protein
MPYGTDDNGSRFERAPGANQRAIVESEAVKAKLEAYEYTSTDVDDIPLDKYVVSREDLASSIDDDVGDVLAIDGSNQFVPVGGPDTATPENGQEAGGNTPSFPPNELGYIQIADVLIDWDELRRQEARRFVSADIASRVSNVNQRPFVFPSGWLRAPGNASLSDSWRTELFELFTEETLEGVPLLSYFKIIIERSQDRSKDGKAVVSSCPHPECDETNLQIPMKQPGDCPGCGTVVYPTDTLRIHETVNERQQNETALTQVMNVIEHIMFAGYIWRLYRTDPERLQDVVFVRDGPLALYQQPAWIHNPIRALLEKIVQGQLDAGLRPPVILGVEKSGYLAEHAELVRGRLEAGDLLAPDDDYIYDHVVPWTASKEGYGARTHYGRSFIYKTESERNIVFSVPLVHNHNGNAWDPTAYHDFGRVLDILDVLVTDLYKDALLPVTLAHQYASLPLSMGSQVLRLFSQQHIRQR